jgi:hypothetical protein
VYTGPGATATDNCDNNPTVTSDPALPATFSGTGAHTITWTATDYSGNNVSCTQTVTVVDVTAPAISCPADVTLEADENCEAEYGGPGATATDNCDANPTVTSDPPLPAIFAGVGDHPILWTATDYSGNSAECTQIVTIVDVTPPVLVGVPPDETVECDAVPEPAGVTAVDNCDPNPTVEFEEDLIEGDCPDDYTLLRTWTATDMWGNSVSATQTITVQDTTPPELDAGFDAVDDEDEDGDDGGDGLFAVRFSGTDNCDLDVDTEGYLDVWGTDESCDEDPEFMGYEVEDGDLVMLECSGKKVDCRVSDHYPTDPNDPDGPDEPLIVITGPAMRLYVTGVDNCENDSEAEAFEICPEPNGCITALTLQNSVGEEKTFYWFEFDKKATLFEVGGEYGEFRTDCKECVMPGDTSGTLTVTCIQAGRKLARKCNVPDDYFSEPCP